MQVRATLLRGLPRGGGDAGVVIEESAPRVHHRWNAVTREWIALAPPPSRDSDARDPPDPPALPPRPIAPATHHPDRGFLHPDGGEHGASSEDSRSPAPSSDSVFGAGFTSFLAAEPLVIRPPSPMAIVPNTPCASPCLRGGVCDRTSGACACPTGFAGAACDEPDEYPCNKPDGSFVGSWCAGACDVTNARCSCGPGSKHPRRPVGSWCQPDMSGYEGWTWTPKGVSGANSDADASPPFHWVYDVDPPARKPGVASVIVSEEDNVTRGVAASWCAHEPAKIATRSSFTTAERFDATPPAVRCKLDCPPGWDPAPDCHRKIHTYCPNQCNARGECDAGFCKCRAGWWGADCSLPAPEPEPEPEPEASTNVAEARDASSSSASTNADPTNASSTNADPSSHARRRARPLVYVYEVPADFTSGTHQRRYRDHECVPRTYKGDAARFTSWYYSLEATFHEYLMRSAHRTTDPAEADFFYAPAYVACYHLKYNHPSPRQTTETLPEPKVRPHGALIRWRALASSLRERLAVPEFAAARAARGFAPPAGDDGTVAMDLSDHVFVAPYDEGACATPEELKTATFLTHWGNTGVPHDESTTGFGNDDWSGLVRAGILPAAAEAPMRCYDPAKDLVVPPWNRARDETTSPSRWARGRRLTLFFFAGDLGTAEGIPNSGPHASEKYSMGIRQRVAASLRDRFPEFDIAGRVQDYERRVERSTFCGVLPGDGWSGGIVTYLRHGCIPVIIQDGVDMPFERVGAWGRRAARARAPEEAAAPAETLLTYASFAVRVREADIHRLDAILGNVSDATVRGLQRGCEDAWRLFSYATPTQPPEGPPRRPAETNEGNVSGDDATRGSHPEIGPADVERVPGDGVGTFEGVPGDAFEMIMASLRYKLALRRGVVAS